MLGLSYINSTIDVTNGSVYKNSNKRLVILNVYYFNIPHEM